MAKKKVEGMVGIQLTPFKANGEVDEESYRRLVRYMLENGNRAIITMGGISESRDMIESQRKRVCEITVEEVDGEIPVIQGVISESTNITVRLAKDAEEVGAQGLMVPYTGRNFGRTSAINEEEMYRHFSIVADAVPELEIMLYDNPGYGAIPISVMKKLAENCSNFKHVKEQVNLQKVTSIKRALGDRIDVLCGTDTYLVPWLQLGCIGGSNSTPNVVPMHVRKTYEAALEKDWDAVNENWFNTWPIIWAFYGQTGARTYKHALYWLGIFDNPRYLNSSRVPKEEALKNTRKILLDMGMKLIR